VQAVVVISAEGPALYHCVAPPGLSLAETQYAVAVGVPITL
jgi:hypothetical protein